ncbi:MAG TPA: hypothetical protein VFQ45_23290, partial [Longimicrobium sp.]|nr:hypothetical protein [Longimicrobium sp.]
SVATAAFVLPLLLIEAVVPFADLNFVETVGNVFYMAAGAAAVVISSAGYLGRRIDGMAAVRQVGPRFFSVWGAAIIQVILIVLGLFLLVIPAFIFAAWTATMQQAVMIEGRNAGESFTRSKELAEGYFWHILATGVVTLLVLFLAGAGLALVLDELGTEPRISLMLSNVAMIFFNPFTYVVSTVLYYDLRIRKEAFDVQLMTEALDEEGPAPA